MGFITTAGVALLVSHSLVAAQDVAGAQYCDATQKTVCYAQFSAATSGTTYRIAIPAVSKAPFDTLVQIVAPNAVSWAGIAWGGSMSQNPLTVAWMNGNQGVVSSRWTTGHTPPAAYSGATYSILSSSKNSTHWQTNFLCTGCSAWETASMDPNGPNKIGYVTGSQTPATPASNTSSISIHSEKGSITQDLSIGKVDSNAFRRFVLFLTNPVVPADPQGPPPPADTPPSNPRTSSGRIPTTIIHASPTGGEEAPPVTRTSVRTSVTTLPRPGSSPQPSSTTGRPATVTVTVTRAPGTTSGVPARPTATGKGKATSTTTCFRRAGRAGRVCTTNPYEDDGDDEDDEGWGGGGWGRMNRIM